MFKRKGFTLVELLIVMAVIAILIAIAIPSFRGMQLEAKKSRAQGDVRVIKIAVESYYKNHSNAYPTFGTTWESSLTGASPQILEQSLSDPFSTIGEYKSAGSSNGQYYVIWSVGVNGASEITGVSDAGVVQGTITDDVYETNGQKQ